MISQTAEYALRAIVQLATHDGQAQTAQQIAHETKVPLHYLSKVLQSLARAKLIHSQRGLHGGFTLLRPPAVLTVFEIVDAVDPVRRITTCPLGLEAHGTNLCPLHKRIDDACLLVEDAFRSSTIADLLAEPTTSKPLCPFPVPLPSVG